MSDDGAQPLPERVTVTLIPRVRQQLADMERDTRMSKTDLVNRAVALYAMFEAAQAHGKRFGILDDHTGEVLAIHVL